MTPASDIAEETMPIMSAYVAGELSAEDEAEVTQALREEPAMRQAFASLVAAWQAPIGRLGVSEAEVDAAYERFKVLRDKAARGR